MWPRLGVFVVRFGPQFEHQPSALHFSRPKPFGPRDKQSLTVYLFLPERHQPCAPVQPKPPSLPEILASAYPSSGGPLNVIHYELCICVLLWSEAVSPVDYARMFVHPMNLDLTADSRGSLTWCPIRESKSGFHSNNVVHSPLF